MKLSSRTGRIAELVIGLTAGVMGIASYMDNRWQYFGEHWLFFVCFLVGAAIIGASVGFLLGKRNPDADVPSKRNQIRVLRGNDEMARSVSELLDRSTNEIRNVTVVQYSGVNAVSAVRQIYERASAYIEVYLVHPCQAINGHQKARIIEWQEKFYNELQNVIDPKGHWKQFTYNAPGSIRAVLIEGHMLYIGAYFYEVVDLAGTRELDTRGGEIPLFAVPRGHPDFGRLESSIKLLVANWKTKDGKGLSTAMPFDRKQSGQP